MKTGNYREDWFIFHQEWMDAMQIVRFTAGEIVRVIDAICDYVRHGDDASRDELGDALWMMYIVMRTQADKNAYAIACKGKE